MAAVDPSRGRGSETPPNTIIGGKYRLESRLAEGGMGTVWVATNLVLEKKVAIKVLHHEHAHSEVAEARLLREARAAAQIGHQNIVQVFDFGKTDTGSPFIVMELLNGEDLGVRLDRVGRLSAHDSVRIMVTVASAVSAAHARGIIHRDLKPQNVFLAVDDAGNETPKVVDFGIAKMRTFHHVPKLTMEGRVVGSPEYLSPEQARGQEDIDARGDIWAYCVTLYECLTGELPFRDANYNRLLRQIIEDEPAPITSYAAGDDALWAIIQRGLRKNRADRWQAMSELAEALSNWAASHNIPDIAPVRFSRPDSFDIADPVSSPSIADPNGALDLAEPMRVSVPEASSPAVVAPRRGNDLTKTSPDRETLTQQKRIRAIIAVAAALALAGVGLVAVTIGAAMTTPNTDAPHSANPIVSALPSLVAAAPSTANSSGGTAPIRSWAPAASALSSAAPEPPDSADLPVASTPTRHAPTTSTPRGTSPSRTGGSKPPPIPTEPNF